MREAVDQRFRGLALEGAAFPDRSPWWEQLVPARLGAEMSSLVREVYGFDVQLCDPDAQTS